MCGRFVSINSTESLSAAFDIPAGNVEKTLEPDYNVAPTKAIQTVRTAGEDGSPVAGAGERELRTARWGFVPSWAKHLKEKPQPINARAEKLTGRMYGRSFARHRVIIPATGFYEWKKATDDHGKEYKQPYFMTDADGVPLAFGGIASWWRDPEAADDAEPLHTVAIITTDAGEQMRDVHDRQPVMLTADEYDLWLDRETDPEALLALTESRDAITIAFSKVTTRVNNVRNNGADLLAPAG